MKIEELNKKYFVATVGGKVLVCYEEDDPEAKRRQLKTYTFTDFRNRYYNQFVQRGDSSVRLGHAWLGWSKRRQHEEWSFTRTLSIQTPMNRNPTIAPHCYNLWKGFAVIPKQGEWSCYRTHLQEVICNGNEEHYNYLIRWMAYGVQHPNTKDGVRSL